MGTKLKNQNASLIASISHLASRTSHRIASLHIDFLSRNTNTTKKQDIKRDHDF